MRKVQQMAGIYIHIPFCRKACHYCNFHFSTNTRLQNDFTKALLQEISNRKNYLSGEKIETIYFGGGTPSLLSETQLFSILDSIHKNFIVAENAEITLEANPDDVNENTVLLWKKAGMNRFSLGVQSFHDDDLQWMNRVHNSHDALACITELLDNGFENFNIDLIYGIPGLTEEKWLENLEIFAKLNITHLSAYSLTVEPNTALKKMIDLKKKTPVDDELSLKHFEMLMDFMEAHNYGHYEISNFSKKDSESKHNTSYWLGKKYIGLGPSAHSFDGVSRQWNISHNSKYIQALTENNECLFEKEILTEQNRYNEYILTRLRTCWGIQEEEMQQQFSEALMLNFQDSIKTFLYRGDVLENKGNYVLSRKGKYIADGIASELMAV